MKITPGRGNLHIRSRICLFRFRFRLLDHRSGFVEDLLVSLMMVDCVVAGDIGIRFSGLAYFWRERESDIHFDLV
jgi:hypothetical protein